MTMSTTPYERERAERQNNEARASLAGATGSGFWLLKRKGEDECRMVFDTEKELSEHLIAMWKFTDWQLVAVCKR